MEIPVSDQEEVPEKIVWDQLYCRNREYGEKVNREHNEN